MRKKESFLRKIVKKLEWSKLVYRSEKEDQVFCCPLCGGVRPSEYLKYSLRNDRRYFNGHSRYCDYRNLN